ncbi:MAG: hypothetical protein JNL21_37290 [Myxococcales bacterium]|nr:hypothetical protein [Myxococcales bacterium]
MSKPVAWSALLCSSALCAAVVACGDDEPQTSGGGGSGGATTATTTSSSSSTTSGMGGQGGGGGEEPVIAPPLRNPVDMRDDALAYESLLLMGYEPIGATNTTCTLCHSINRGLLESWRDLSDTAVATCFADPTVPTKAAIETALDCLRQKPNNPNSPIVSPKLGIYSAAAHLAWFDFVFERLYGADSTQHGDFIQAVAMPKQMMETPWTQDEFDIVAEWFARGLPFMEELVPDENLPTSCTPNITPAVADHVAAMSMNGWRAANTDAGLLMFGCAGAATTLDCLSTFPQAGTLPYGTGWEYMPGTKLRVLRTNNYSSSYWTRSSPDGRFVGHGGGASGGSTIVDLATNQEIGLDAAYDPGFFPDNSAFMFQATPSGTGICKLSLLSSGTTYVAFNEPECGSASQIGLYQHVGATLGGGDYWAIDGSFVSDNGGFTPTQEQPNAFFNSGADVDITPMVYDGTSFNPKQMVSQPTPNEGDTIMSPSSLLLMGRVAGGGWNQNGFRLRQLVATPNGNSYTVIAPEIGRYCVNGGKPGISYDERWAVLHRYVEDADAVELGFSGPNDPGFQQYASQGAANIYLLDLLTGILRRVTHMKPGQYALYPHFRSDGWVYFMVRTLGSDQEHIVASDAALVLE